MFSSDNWKSRFNLLYLHESEVKTDEKSARWHFVDEENKRSEKETGLLHIGSKSLYLESMKENHSIFKILMKNFHSDIEGHSLEGDGGYELSFWTDCYTEISILSNTPSEHKQYFLKKQMHVVIQLEKNQGVKAWIQTLMNLNRSISLSGLDHIYEISKMLMMHFNFKSLDMNRLESINEVPMFKDEIFIKHIQPLTINYGFLLVTNLNMYIQPVTTKEDKAIRFNQKSIQRMFKRRHNLKDLALEMFTQDGASYFLAFDSPEIRDKVFEIVRHRSPGCKTNIDVDLEELTESWKCREMSNYEYLLKLNEFAQRSLNDLSQYPVFPWILQDYTSEQLNLEDTKVYRDLSKPIGALNEERLAGFIERSQHYTQGQVYLYGTHYSSPFYVVGYLVRQYPLYMLHLNNGRFDRSDRIFNSIAEDWKLCLNSSSIVKELIPQFYESDDSFLVNKLNLNLGVRHTGELIEDVGLPPWAKKDSKLFLKKMREALESDYVSSHLHEWIDLIFGYKQKGKDAEEAHNVFNPISYEGEIDIEAIKDPIEKKAIVLQIQEFGQIPKQLFKTPHPSRNSPPSRKPSFLDSPVDEDRFRSPATFKEGILSQLTPQTESLKSSIFGSPKPETPILDKRTSQFGAQTLAVTLRKQIMLSQSAITDAIFIEETNTALCLSDDGNLRKVNFTTMDIECCIKVASSSLTSISFMGGKYYAIASVEGNIYSLNYGYAAISQKHEAHYQRIKKLEALPEKVVLDYKATDLFSV